jgi:RecB family exonuclease
MAIDPKFTFSANSLQDYLNCPRRFELKYLLKQDWPAETSQPVLEFEHHLQLGNQFHQLAQRYLNGIPEKVLGDSITDSDLAEWFQNFLAFYASLELAQTYTEFPVHFFIKGFEVKAVFDLLAVDRDGILNIFDWKTSLRLPRKDSLTSRMQTILYPLAVVEACADMIPDFKLTPGAVRMTYLYVAHKNQNVFQFDYSADQYDVGKGNIEGLIAEIKDKEPGSFACTSNKRLCKYCVYRSLCERGTSAGEFENFEEEDLEDLIARVDFDAQDEIAF